MNDSNSSNRLTLSEILAEEPLRRREFPVAQEQVFLGHAGVCPLPRRVADAVQQCARQGTRGDQEAALPAYLISQTRKRAAQLLQGKPEEIAWVGPTSLGLSYVAAGLSFEKNQNVLVYMDDYPSNVYPWMALAKQGVEVRFIKTRQLGRIEPAELLSQVDSRTRLVALASCHFISGYRPDYQTIGEELHRRNILFCLDSIQTLGAFPTTVEHIDFLAADAHKWLLGPCAAGILYVREELQDQLQPAVYGWNNLRCPDFITQPQLELRSGARRYEAGTHNLLGLAGLNAALELIEEIGLETISTEILRKRDWLVPALLEKGYHVLQADAPALNAGGIISFYRANTDMAALHQALHQADIFTSLRVDRSGQKYIRLSPHFYNTDAELNQVLARV